MPSSSWLLPLSIQQGPSKEERDVPSDANVPQFEMLMKSRQSVEGPGRDDKK